MNKYTQCMGSLIALAWFALAWQPAQAQPQLGASVVGSGATLASGGSTVLQATLGQAVIGRSTSAGATAHHGFWYMRPEAGVSIVERQLDAAVGAAIAITGVVPNPCSAATTIHISLAERADVSLGLYDRLGRRALTLIDGVRAAGTHSLELDMSGLASGSYVLRLVAGDQSTTTPVTVLR